MRTRESADAVIRAYGATGDVIETQEPVPEYRFNVEKTRQEGVHRGYAPSTPDVGSCREKRATTQKAKLEPPASAAMENAAESV